MYGEGAIAKRTARDWYAKFKNGNIGLKDETRSGRQVELDEERINQRLQKTSHLATRELADKMKCSHTATEKHLYLMEKDQKCGALVPYA